VFFKLVNNSQSHHKSSAQMCHQKLEEQLQNFYKKLISRWDSKRQLFTTTSYAYYEIQKKRQKQTVKQSL